MGTASLAAMLRARLRARRAKSLADRLDARREVEEGICDAALKVFDAHGQVENLAADAFRLKEEIEILDAAQAGARNPTAAIRARAAERIAELTEEAAPDQVDADLAEAITDVKLAVKYALVIVGVRARLDEEAAEEAIRLADESTGREELIAQLAERRIAAVMAPLMRRAYEQTVASFPEIGDISFAKIKSALEDLVFPPDD